MHIALLLSSLQTLLPGLRMLEGALIAKSEEKALQKVVKSGRTHLQDAVPMTVAQEFGAWGTQVREGRLALERSLEEDVMPLAQGGTAVGTGLNAAQGFREKFVEELNKIVFEEKRVGLVGLGTTTMEALNPNLNDEKPKFKFSLQDNPFAGIAAHDALARFAGLQSALATSFLKIANDVKLLSSTVVGELQLDVELAGEPGSSIMPGKVNPTQAEALSMIGVQVMAFSSAVQNANAHGQLQLNALKPLMLWNLLEGNRLLGEGAKNFAEKCVGGWQGSGLQPNEKKIGSHLERNLMLATALNPVIGYEKAAKVAKLAGKTGKTLREAAVEELKFLSGEEFDRIVDAGKMVGDQSWARKKSKSEEEL